MKPIVFPFVAFGHRRPCIRTPLQYRPNVFKFLVAASLLVLASEALFSGPATVDASDVEYAHGEVEVSADLAGVQLSPQLVASGLETPTDIVGSPTDDRLFIVEKAGRIRVVEDGVVLPDPMIDLSAWIKSDGNEQGMLSLRLHPEFEQNGRLFIFFTDLDGTSQLVEARADQNDPNRIALGSLQLIMTIPQYGQYHQSGSMFFAPDGLLWISLGDGGGIGDPEGHGQDFSNIDASILRIDVDSSWPYGVPDDNPEFGPGARPEIWAYGLRNPWRISFDSVTGLLFIPDVGQEGSEEVNVVRIDEGGHNFGWSVSEGTGCYETENCSLEGQTLPVYQYLHEGNGCAIVGGQVYRGQLMPEVRGHYFFADFCLGWIRSIVADESEVYLVKDWTTRRDDRLGNVTTIGADRNGELYVANMDGEIWHLELADK